jgi:hypothetical protein
MELNDQLHAPESLSRKRTPLTTEGETGWVPKPILTSLRRRNYPDTAGIRSSDRPACSLVAVPITKNFSYKQQAHHDVDVSKTYKYRLSETAKVLTLVRFSGLEKSQPGATNRYPHFATFRVACNRRPPGIRLHFPRHATAVVTLLMVNILLKSHEK